MILKIDKTWLSEADILCCFFDKGFPENLDYFSHLPESGDTVGAIAVVAAVTQDCVAVHATDFCAADTFAATTTEIRSSTSIFFHFFPERFWAG